MPSWITPALKKSKKSQRKRGLTVRFVDMGGDDVKNPLATSSPLVKSPLTDGSIGNSPMTPHDLSVSDESMSNCSSDLHENLSDLDEDERECLRHLDDLGHALENTFKEVESIDAYVSRMRDDFDHDRMMEHRYMTCMCSAKIARTACCKRQIETWKELQHGMQDLLCHYCHHHSNDLHSLLDNVKLSGKPDCSRNCGGDNGSHNCHEEEVNELLSHLRRMTMFDNIVHRLNPGGDQKSFVEQWIIHCTPL